MAMLVFGTKIEVPKAILKSETESLVGEILKRRNERRLFFKLLDSPSLAQGSVLEEIIQTAANTFICDSDMPSVKDKTFNFYLQKLHQGKTLAGLPVFQDLVLRLVEQNSTGPIRDYARLAREGKFKGKMPRMVADLKKAESILTGKLGESIGEKEISSYLQRENLKAILRSLAGDLFYALNHSLSDSKAITFVRCQYELRKRQTALPGNSKKMMENLSCSLKNNSTFHLYHLKCLRFVYPYGTRLLLLEDTNDLRVPTKNGQYHQPLGETNLAQNLLSVDNIFRRLGVSVKLHLLLSDQDLIDYFPHGGSGIVPDSDLNQAYLSLRKYQYNLSRLLPDVEVHLLSEFLKSQGVFSEFNLQKENILSALTRGTSLLPGGFVEDRVNYRYESNKNIFRCDPGRQFARDRVYAQLSSLQALGVLGKIPDFGFLIEEDRGDENNYIGGIRSNSLPVFFTKLRDNPQAIVYD